MKLTDMWVIRLTMHGIPAFYAVRFGRYGNERIAIQLLDGVTGDLSYTATVNMVNATCDTENSFVHLKGWSENDGLPQALEDAGVIKRTGNYVPNEFIQATEATLTEKAQQELVRFIEMEVEDGS